MVADHHEVCKFRGLDDKNYSPLRKNLSSVANAIDAELLQKQDDSSLASCVTTMFL